MKLRIVDDLTPEDTAMLQALYSRSAESVDVHLEKVKQSGSGKFMQSYYVGYNHKSISDCGSTTMFIENVSLLAAKAVQDWPLYSGQETSTRYIDMAKQPIVDPYATMESKEILQRWMNFYTSKQDRVAETVRARHPRRDGEDHRTYERAVTARTFDILRGFLPAGITTQLSWHTNLRQAGDHLEWMLHHPVPEIVQIATRLRATLAEKYSSSGFDKHLAGVSGVDNKNDREATLRQEWIAEASSMCTYASAHPVLHYNDFDFDSRINIRADSKYFTLLRDRPRGCALPPVLGNLGHITVHALLDFGSFRDLQRHRHGFCQMPLLDTSWGFEPWYLDQLDDDTRREAEALIDEQKFAIVKLGFGSPKRSVLRQYYDALGFRVPIDVTYNLPAALYVMELRAGKTVHPTLRTLIHKMVKAFTSMNQYIAVHADMDPDDWDVRRGAQTITQKRIEDRDLPEGHPAVRGQ